MKVESTGITHNCFRNTFNQKESIERGDIILMFEEIYIFFRLVHLSGLSLGLSWENIHW